jgi:hypothetical protein
MRWNQINGEHTGAVKQGLVDYRERLLLVAAFAADQSVTEIANTCKGQAEAVTAILELVAKQENAFTELCAPATSLIQASLNK